MTDKLASLILIVEDNEKNLKLVRDILQFKGHRTLEATNAEDGIALAASHLPDLVLMDIRLPGMDGTEAARRTQGGRPDGATSRSSLSRRWR